MPANFVKGDILDEASQSTGPRALAFAADCGGATTAGVAAAVAKRWPAFADAFRAHAGSGKMQLGDVFEWREGDLRVYALGVMKGAAKPKVSSIERALRAALERAATDAIPRVLVPRVGGGKTGLDWTRVKRVLTDAAAERAIEVVVFEQFVRKPA